STTTSSPRASSHATTRFTVTAPGSTRVGGGVAMGGAGGRRRPDRTPGAHRHSGRGGDRHDGRHGAFDAAPWPPAGGSGSDAPARGGPAPHPVRRRVALPVGRARGARGLLALASHPRGPNPRATANP